MKKIIILIICMAYFFAIQIPVYSEESKGAFDKRDDILISQEIVKESIEESLVLFVGTSRASVNGVKRFIDKSNPDVMPININGRVLVPIRLIAESFGGVVSWDEKQNLISIIAGDKTITIKIGEKIINVNGANIGIDTEAIIDNGRTFLPLRAISEVLSKKVFWHNWGLIIISDEKSRSFEQNRDKYLINEIIRYLLIDTFNVVQLDDILIDGKSIEGFDAKKRIYSIGLPFTSKTPIIEAKSSKYSIITNSNLSGGMDFKVIDDETGFSTIYTVQTFIEKLKPEEKREPVFSKPSGLTEIKPINVTASAVPQLEYSPENTIDKNLDTRWSAEGEQWIQYELNEEKEIGAISISFHVGDRRVSWIEVLLSDDGENWQTVTKEESCGISNEQEVFTFESKKAKYLRIMGYGNSQNRWNSITEVSVFGN